MKSTNKIWLLLDSRDIGGIETHVYELSSGMNELIQTEVVFMNHYGEHPLEYKLKDAGIAYKKLDGKTSTLLTKIKNERPLLVHTHGYKAGIVGRVLCKLLNIACVSTFHAGEKCQGKLKLYDFADRFTAGLASHCFCVSQEISDRIYASNELVNNFVNSKIAEIQWGNKIAFVGRISEEKGPDIFCSISAAFKNRKFHLYGDGKERDHLEEKYQEQGNVIFHGFRDMSKEWDDIELLIITSRFEGLPLAALEAMARGIPVISSRVGAMCNLINQGVNGWLVEVGDINAYAKYIEHWSDFSLEEKMKMKRAANQVIKQDYTEKKVIGSLFNTYCNVVERKNNSLNIG